MKRVDAKAQFDYHTKHLKINHTFSFDEMWDYLEHKREERQIIQKVDHAIKRNGYRAAVAEFERITSPVLSRDRNIINTMNPLKHTFSDGVCVREITNPKGALIITKIHKREHPYFLLKGDMSIMTEAGPRRIKAPHYGITPVGTKRIILTHEECVFVTIHATNVKTVRELEDEFFTEDFKDIDEIESKKLTETLSKEEVCQL